MLCPLDIFRVLFCQAIFFRKPLDIDRKSTKKRIWLLLNSFSHPIADWLTYCKSSNDLPSGTVFERPQPHNTINRMTNTTTGPDFAPYAMNQLWYGRAKSAKNSKEIAEFPLEQLEIYLVLDESRLSSEELCLLFVDIGALGFGRDASIGLGKFSVIDFSIFHFPHQTNADAWLTLAPCAPQGLDWEENRCFYQPFTRFGRHGDIGVHLGNPFKTPVLLAETGAVLTPIKFEKNLFTGQGLGGDGSLSKNDALRGTVHQGYAPVIGIALCLSNSVEVL